MLNVVLFIIVVVVFGAATLPHSALTSVGDHTRLFPVVLASSVTFSPSSVVLSQFFSDVVSVFAFPKAIVGIHSKRFSWLGFVSLKTYLQPAGTGRGDSEEHFYPPITGCSF